MNTKDNINLSTISFNKIDSIVTENLLFYLENKFENNIHSMFLSKKYRVTRP